MNKTQSGNANNLVLYDVKAGTRPSRRRAPFHPTLITTASVIIAVLLWEYFGRNVDPLFSSYPTAIARKLWAMTADGTLFRASMQSLQPLAAGFALAVVLGIPMGLLLGRFRWFEAAFGIYVTAGYAMPLIALIPLFVLWFGLGFTVKVAIVTLLSFFPICINTWIGVKAVPKTLVEVGKSFVASPLAILIHIVLPASVPYVMAGIRLAVGKAIIAMIVAEFFTAISGLGGIILTASNNFETAEMLAPIIVIMVFAVVITALLERMERWVAPWHAETSGQRDS